MTGLRSACSSTVTRSQPNLTQASDTLSSSEESLTVRSEVLHLISDVKEIGEPQHTPFDSLGRFQNDRLTIGGYLTGCERISHHFVCLLLQRFDRLRQRPNLYGDS